jgi:hypothetical protein
MIQLTMFQNFNAMRFYMTVYFETTKDEDIGLLLSGFMLSTKHLNWKENILTWDAAAWEDWMAGVNKTLKDMNLLGQDPMKIKYDERMSFLCMKNYLNIFYEEIKFEGVNNILKIINAIDIGNLKDKEWIHWLDCIQQVVAQEPNIIG